MSFGRKSFSVLLHCITVLCLCALTVLAHTLLRYRDACRGVTYERGTLQMGEYEYRSVTLLCGDGLVAVETRTEVLRFESEALWRRYNPYKPVGARMTDSVNRRDWILFAGITESRRARPTRWNELGFWRETRA